MLRSIVVLASCACLVGAAPAAAQLPTVTVDAATLPMANFGSHRGITVTASCPAGSVLTGGGSYVRNAADPAVPPTNGLVLGGTLPSAGDSPVDHAIAERTFDVSHWMGIANFTGVSEAGDQAAALALCASAGSPSRNVVVTSSTTGANTAQELAQPALTTATCPPLSRLLSGGAMTRTPDQVDDGVAVGNNGNLKPLAGYPSDAAGVPAADGSRGATSWTAYGSAGITSPTDTVTAFAVCSIDFPSPPVRVARLDRSGPDAQAGTTTLDAPVSCPGGTRLVGGGYKVDESVGLTDGLQPQQGYHMRGSYPAADAAGSTEAADGATNPTTWTSLVQAGGQNLATGKHMNLHGFAMCLEVPAAAPDLGVTVASAPARPVAGQPLTLTLNVANHGGDSADVQVVDTLPAGAAFESVDDARCAQAAGKVTCALAAVAGGATATIRIVVTPAAAGPAVNRVEVTPLEPDAAAGDNVAETTVDVRAFPPASPTLAGRASGAGLVGQPISAAFALAGGASPAGAVTFFVYGPGDDACANALATSTAAVAGDGEYASAPFTPAQAGTYRWTARYGGDPDNEPAATACGAPIAVRALPSLTLDGSTATLSGGSAIGGSLTFSVLDASCSAVLASVEVGVAGNGSYAAPAFVAPGPGTYHWIAGYGGDERNAPVGPTPCGAAFVVTAPPSSQPPPVVLAGKPSNAFRLRRAAKASRTGVVTLTLDAPGAGSFRLSARAGGSAYARATRTAHAKGALKITLEPSAKAKRLLRRHTRVKVTVSITFTPTGGAALTKKATVTVKRS